MVAGRPTGSGQPCAGAGERFDPDGDYVRRWVPELGSIAGGAVHRPWDVPLLASDYPAPIVDHAARRVEALRRYKAARESARRG